MSFNPFAPKLGSWGFHSKKDPRWEVHGRGSGFVMGGMDAVPEAREKFDELKKKYGNPPDDLEYSFWKD